MSQWCHVTGAIKIDINQCVKDTRKFLLKKLADAPPIYGSEGNCDVFLNVLSGYNGSIYKAPDKLQEYQSCAVVTVVGDLRDTNLPTVKEEVMNFIDYIRKKHIEILEGVFVIYDELLEEPCIINVTEG